MGFVQGFTLPTSELAHKSPFPWQTLVLMPLIVVDGAFFNKDIPGAFFIGKRIDQWFGHDTYRSFMKSLKPELLFSCMCFGIGIIGFVRTFQLDGPSGAVSISAFFTSGGFAFLAAHSIGHWHRLYEIHPATTEVKEYSSVDAATFWNEAKRRRNLIFAVFFGWLVAGPLLVILYSQILPSTPPYASGFAALGTLGCVVFWMQIRFNQLRCFRCGKQAFSNPLFFMKDAKCRCCGITREDV